MQTTFSSLFQSLRNSPRQREDGASAFSMLFKRAASCLSRNRASFRLRRIASHILTSSQPTMPIAMAVPSDIEITTTRRFLPIHDRAFPGTDQSPHRADIIDRMALDLLAADAFATEAEAMRLLLARPYRWGDVVAFVDKALLRAQRYEVKRGRR